MAIYWPNRKIEKPNRTESQFGSVRLLSLIGSVLQKIAKLNRIDRCLPK